MKKSANKASPAPEVTKAERHTMKAKEKKQAAQDLIMQQISIIGYGDSYREFVDQIGSQEEADKVLMDQMNRVAKMFGFKAAWFS